ncbi:hypothetical protein LTR62_000558 [Meristemomyces frigidus]|uniref:EamA domain-containing protein n=1 Tax=Meristemomyces frigidus TaxID=1508187 RepID=A0AAN7YC75_9PEZI|nr:hypothetical protein LTR62_000558 [Meristemomyces frigidus]
MAFQHKQEQGLPFLDHGRDSDDLELPDLDTHGRQANHDRLDRLDRTPASHYHQPLIQPRKDTRFAVLVSAALATTVIGFVINTEATEYFEAELGWKKPLASMYITHSSLMLPWVIYVFCSRLRSRNLPFRVWLAQHRDQLSDALTATSTYKSGTPDTTRTLPASSPLKFLITSMGFLTFVLTASGLSWFIALAWTTPADLTAIYNCSTFFAAAFSVPLLKERLGLYSIVAVGLSIIGTFVIAYGDTTANHDPMDKVGTSRFFGNIVACLGALAFGLYEVLFKKWACSAQPMRPEQSLPLTLFASALTGFYTFIALWPGLVVAHLTGYEVFVWPAARTWLWIITGVLSGSISITMLAVLVVWTDPVFGSFANVLSVFFIAFSDWLIFGLSLSLATYVGGGLVTVAFSLLTWDTFVAKSHDIVALA